MTHPSLLEQWDVDIPAGPEPEKVYVGRRLAAGGTWVTVVEGGDERPLRACSGSWGVDFEWGYNGAGPTALAAAILSDHLDYSAPIDTVVAYRRAVVSRLRSDGWAIGSADLRAWLATHLTEGRP